MPIIIPIKKVVIFIHVADELFIIRQMKYMTAIMIHIKTIENITNNIVINIVFLYINLFFLFQLK